MKILFKSLLILAVIVIQSCSNDDDSPDCSTVLCAQPEALLEFKFVDSETGENLADDLIDGSAIEVTNTSSNTEPEYEFISENDLNILRISISETSDYSISYEGEEIFNLSVEAERQTGGCCTNVEIQNLEIGGAEFEIESETGIYLIKTAFNDKNLENYHVFFENSKLQTEPEEESHVNTESLQIDVVSGEKLVFKLLMYDDPEETIADDEVTKIVYFEINPEATEFTLTSDNFEEANAVIGISGGISYIKPIESGEITGTKISDDEWEVAIKAAVGEEGESFSITVEESQKVFSKSTYQGVWMPIYN